VGVFASRQIALACERHLACLAIGGHDRPACRPLSALRQRPLAACTGGWVQGVRLAAEAGLVPGGHGATEGTHIQGKAARPQARREG
jgi:hypothetical protein